jgi:hypothetical protein
MAGLSERTKKFVMEITQNGVPPLPAAKAVGIPEHAVPTLMSHPVVKRDIETSLDGQGLTPAFFSSKMRELCEATTPKGDPDWSARAKGLGMLKDILGYEAPKQVQQTTTVVTYEERLLMIAEEERSADHGIITEISCRQETPRIGSLS